MTNSSISFYLIRHGQKEKKSGDPALTELGKGQAKKTGKLLKQFAIKHVYSSPTKRAIQTADVIANTCEVESSTDILLKERVNWGDDPKQTLEDFLMMWNKASFDRKWQPPVGDSSVGAGNRLIKFLKIQLNNLKDGESIAIIAHGGIIVDGLLNIFDENYLNNIIPNFTKHRDALLSECSVTKLNYDTKSKSYYIEYLASVDHLK